MSKHNVIFESLTNTIRLMPEDRCLAYKVHEKGWRTYPNTDSRPYLNLIADCISQCGRQGNGKELAGTLDAAIKESDNFL